jgi:hypothetical protein
MDGTEESGEDGAGVFVCVFIGEKEEVVVEADAEVSWTEGSDSYLGGVGVGTALM